MDKVNHIKPMKEKYARIWNLIHWIGSIMWPMLFSVSICTARHAQRAEAQRWEVRWIRPCISSVKATIAGYCCIPTFPPLTFLRSGALWEERTPHQTSKAVEAVQKRWPDWRKFWNTGEKILILYLKKTCYQNQIVICWWFMTVWWVV